MSLARGHFAIRGRLLVPSSRLHSAPLPPSATTPYDSANPPPKNIVLRSYRHLMRACATHIDTDPDAALEVMSHIRSAYVNNIALTDSSEILEAYKAALDGAYVLQNEIKTAAPGTRVKIDANQSPDHSTLKIETTQDALYTLWKETGGKLVLPPGVRFSADVLENIQASFTARRAAERKARKQRVAASGGEDAERECKDAIAKHAAKAAADATGDAASGAKSTYSVPDWLSKAPQAHRVPE